MNREELEKNLFFNILSVMKENGLEKLASSVILTGSFGRGEATYYSSPEGLELKSDIEIAVVYTCSKRRIAEFVKSVSAKFPWELNLMPITPGRIKKVKNFNGGIITPKRKTLFTYDLYSQSITLWGEDYISKKRVEVSEIDTFEAKRIVANRIGELVYISDKKPEDIIIWKSKLMLASACAYLLLRGGYASSCKKQAEAVKARREEVSRELGGDFVSDYLGAFSFLREGGSAVDIDEEKLRMYAAGIDALFERYNIKKSRVTSLSRRAKYLFKYLKNGAPLGLAGFEEKIIDSLIRSFISGDNKIKETAGLWHEVLY